MCYLVAKWFDEPGCVALSTEPGRSLIELKRRLDARFGHDRLQLVTITRPSAYGEYEPYTFVSTEEELARVLERQASLQS